MSINKTQNELRLSIDSATVKPLTGNVQVKITIQNPHIQNASLGTLQYSTDSGQNWNDCLLAGQEVDINDITITGKVQHINLYWDAANDLWMVQEFTDIQVRLSLYDQANQAGTDSEILTTTIASIDFRPGYIQALKILKPYKYDPYMDFDFYSKMLIRNAHEHFEIDVDDQEDFSSPTSIDSATDQTGWTVDGSAMPAEGAAGDQEHRIKIDHADFDALANGEYYHRILAKVYEQNPPVQLLEDNSGNLVVDENGRQMVSINDYTA